MTQNTSCRLCGSALTPAFTLDVLARHTVSYLTCQGCHSLQTETPYWLDEAYGSAGLPNIDTGAAQRNLHNLAACFVLAKWLRLKNAIDIGGGDGLLCRLLRDHGMHCFVSDKYAAATYARGFTDPDFERPDLVIGFEVMEHYAEPAKDLDALFAGRPRALLLSTGIYAGQDSAWWYLAPEAGQHVFFYSVEALRIIAKRYGYALVLSGGYILYVRSASALTRAWLALVLKRPLVRLARSLMAVMPTPGVWRDHARQVDMVRRDRKPV